MENIAKEQWKTQLAEEPDAIIIDVRTPREWAEGIIPGAHTINIHDTIGFLAAIERLDRSRSIYIYCRSGARSAQACSWLDDLGFKKTYNLLGGMITWDGDVVQKKAA